MNITASDPMERAGIRLVQWRFHQFDLNALRGIVSDSRFPRVVRRYAADSYLHLMRYCPLHPNWNWQSENTVIELFHAGGDLGSINCWAALANHYQSVGNVGKELYARLMLQQLKDNGVTYLPPTQF